MADVGNVAHLKAQIALLQTSLYASHQRILELSHASGLNISMSSSGRGGSSSPLQWTPVNGLMGLPEVDGLGGSTPGSDLMGASALIEEDELGDRSGSELLPDGEGESYSFDMMRSEAITTAASW